MSKIWTLEEQEILKANYPYKNTDALLPLLPTRTISGIIGQASKLRIKKSDAFYEAGLGGRICNVNDIGKNTRFTNNMAGWNKGKLQSDFMSPEMIEKTKATRFKKGQDPHNVLPIGSERISKDGYVEIKVRHVKGDRFNNKNYEFKHKIIYEKNHGPIPEGMMVVFNDGDKLNFAPENLLAITRAENLLKNSYCDTSIVKRFLKVKDPKLVEKVISDMPETIKLKRNTLLLNQKINKKENAKND